MKIIKRSNYRVVTEVHTWGKPDEKYEARQAEKIKDEIKRHVDDIGQVWVECDTDVTCSHCGYGWEVDEQTGEPQCCSKAQQEFEVAKPLTP